ncbi:30S ribosomal protein S4 [Candidatus Woesearchaeota archaeon]|nr:30S ribosomal protein S4 [Candidatus Woesearchaeota archaeon]
MGDPKKTRKKYQKPSHPWQKERIEEEKVLMKEYALKNKLELWKANSQLRDFKKQTKNLASSQTEQAQIEKNNLIKKLQKLGLVQDNAQIDDILGLSIKNILDRRLQTIVYKKGFSRTIGQARQFITHRHIIVDEKNIDAPGYLVPKESEHKITFKTKSALANTDHPERVQKAPAVVSTVAETKKQEVSA